MATTESAPSREGCGIERSVERRAGSAPRASGISSWPALPVRRRRLQDRRRRRHGHTDPRALVLFLRWLRCFFDLDESRLRMRVYLHECLDLEAATSYWSELTGIPWSQFGAPYRAADDPTRRTSKHLMGCPAIRYHWSTCSAGCWRSQTRCYRDPFQSGLAQSAAQRPVKPTVGSSSLPPGAPIPSGARSLAADRLLQLGLVHLRPAPDALLLRLVVELCPRAPAGPLVRSQPAAPARRDVLHRRAAALPGLTRSCPLLVHGAGGDLLGRVLGLAPLLQPGLDVLVLALPLGAPCSAAARWTSWLGIWSLPVTRSGQDGDSGAVAQRSEQRTHNPSCVGSTPTRPTGCGAARRDCPWSAAQTSASVRVSSPLVIVSVSPERSNVTSPSRKARRVASQVSRRLARSLSGCEGAEGDRVAVDDGGPSGVVAAGGDFGGPVLEGHGGVVGSIHRAVRRPRVR